MQLPTILLTALAAASTIMAGPVPQPLPDADTLAEIALQTRSLQARAEQATQAQQAKQAEALAQIQQWGRRYSAAGGRFDLNVLGLLGISASGGRVDYGDYGCGGWC